MSSLGLLVPGDRLHKGHRIWNEKTWVQVVAQLLKSYVTLDTHLMSGRVISSSILKREKKNLNSVLLCFLHAPETKI